jgi:hypothetical protein
MTSDRPTTHHRRIAHIALELVDQANPRTKFVNAWKNAIDELKQ